MKKNFIIMICVIMVLTFVGCKNNQKDNEKETYKGDAIYEKALNEEYSLANVTNEIKTDSMKVLSKSEIETKYNFGNSNLEVAVMQEETQENYEEIAIAKLSDEKQIYEIQEAMLKRVENLKEEYKNNETIKNILENDKNIKIKVQDGIAILIISTKSEEKMQIFDSTFIYE